MPLERRFECPEEGCRATFAQQGEVVRHQDALHNQVRRYCQYSSCQFPGTFRASELQAHMREKHSEVFNVASYPLDGLGHEKVPVPDLVQKDPLTPKQNSASSLINHRPHPAGVLDGHSTRDRSMPPESHTVFTPCIDAVSHDPRYGYRMKGALPNSMYTPRSPSSMVPTQELLAKMVEHIPYNDIRLQEIISESGGRNNAEGHTSADAQDTELGYGENYRW